jgi:hypothetical protein
LLAQIFLCVDSSIPTAYLLTQFFSSRVGLAAVFSTLEFCFQEQVRLGLNSPASDIFAARAASFLEDVRSLVEAIRAARFVTGDSLVFPRRVALPSGFHLLVSKALLQRWLVSSFPVAHVRWDRVSRFSLHPWLPVRPVVSLSATPGLSPKIDFWPRVCAPDVLMSTH